MASEFSTIDEESTQETSEMLHATRRCCFCIPHRSSAIGTNWWRRMRPEELVNSGGWWARGIGAAVMKLREWSEIAAGPRWKTFIRRFNRRSKSGNKNGMRFQYDPLSYSLNFDDGAGQKCGNNGSEEEAEYGFPNFSSRYAAVPASAKSSMDLGNEAVVFA